jgi:hypothetical protein
MDDRQKAIEDATDAGYAAAIEMLEQLNLSEEEMTEALWAAAMATDAAKLSVSANSFVHGSKVRMDITVSAALAAALAGLTKRDEVLKEKGYAT